MRKWLKIAVPLGVAALALTVLTVGFPSTGSNAAQCFSGPGGDVMTCRAGSTMYQFDFCSDPSVALRVTLDWENSHKDLALRVTTPDGTQQLVDRKAGSSEVYSHSPALP